MKIVEPIRSRLLAELAGGTTLYRIAQDTGIRHSRLWEFSRGQSDGSPALLERLAARYGATLAFPRRNRHNSGK